MCGVVGYVGNKEVMPILLEGLKRLEYRGYDSAGVAFMGPMGIVAVKSVGRIETLVQRIETLKQELNGCQPKSIGIAHTRWATHGLPTEENAHPHIDAPAADGHRLYHFRHAVPLGLGSHDAHHQAGA